MSLESYLTQNNQDTKPSGFVAPSKKNGLAELIGYSDTETTKPKGGKNEF